MDLVSLLVSLNWCDCFGFDLVCLLFSVNWFVSGFVFLCLLQMGCYISMGFVCVLLVVFFTCLVSLRFVEISGFLL